MQKTLFGILAGATLLTTVVLGFLCFTQSKQLRASREEVRALEVARHLEAEAHEAQAARVKELERAAARLDQQVGEFAKVTTKLRASESLQTSNLTTMAEQMRATLKRPGTNASGEEEKGGVFGKGVGEMLGKMMKDPAMREVLREQQKATINLMYAGLFKDLKLAPEEKDRLKEILTDAQMKGVEAAGSLFGGGKEGDENSAAETTRQFADAKAKTDADIKALLGDERFTQFEDYQKTMGERMQVDQFQKQLAGENLPLRDEQSAQLLQIMKEEKAAVPPAISSDQDQIPKKETFTSENIDKQLSWMDDYNRRVLDRAKQVLTPEQSKQYQSFQEQQTSMQKLSLQMVRSMFGGTAPAPPAPTPVK